MNAVFYHDDRQRQLAMASKSAVEKKIGQRVKTEVAPLRTFTMAEDYHQKYIIKQHNDLKAEMSRIYPLHRNFVDSTAVARLNGYTGGTAIKSNLKAR
jgi:peptide-methionine (S)-S-oxide reductase